MNCSAMMSFDCAFPKGVAGSTLPRGFEDSAPATKLSTATLRRNEELLCGLSCFLLFNSMDGLARL